MGSLLKTKINGKENQTQKKISRATAAGFPVGFPVPAGFPAGFPLPVGFPVPAGFPVPVGFPTGFRGQDIRGF